MNQDLPAVTGTHALAADRRVAPDWVEPSAVIGAAVLCYWAIIHAAASIGVASIWTHVGAAVVSLAGPTLYVREGIVPFRCRDRSRSVTLLTISVFTLALAARVYTISMRPLWDDEGWTLHIVYGGSLGDVIKISIQDFWPPLHYVIVNGVARILDTGALNLRLPSVVFGVMTVALLPALGRMLFGRPAIGSLAALLLAGAVPHVLYSQMARVYALQVLLGVVCSHYFYKAFVQSRVSAGHVAATSLLLYCHAYSWYLVAAHWLFIIVAVLLLKMRTQLMPALKAQGIVLLLYAPLIMSFAYVRYVQQIQVPVGWANGPDHVTFAAVPLLFASLSVRSGVGVGCFAMLTVLVAIVTYRASVRPGVTPGEARGVGQEALLPFIFVACWVITPAAVSLFASIVTPMRSFGPVKYHLVMLPGICLLAAAGLSAIRSRISLVIIFATVATVAVTDLQKYYREFDYPHFDDAARFVKSRRQPAERIYLGNGFRVFNYYYNDQYPRMGSRDWDAFDAQFAGLENIFVDGTQRYGYSHRSEKMYDFITYLSTAPRQALAEGRLSPPFWVVVGEPAERQLVQTAVDSGAYRIVEAVPFKDVDVFLVARR
ncbi:MAG: glycosyltransferase family 39 protein [Acidobacteriota bacterium]